jgi:HEAT repeat protein
MKLAPRLSALPAACLAAALLLLSRQSALAADAPTVTQESLIQVLQSDAPAQDKAITCKKLAIYGQKEAVPAVAALLTHPELSSWARIALEAIPDPSADAALREALSKVQGRLLVGVINSIGVRRDAKAVADLARLLKGAEPAAASAAAEALGRIGGAPASKALEDSFAKSVGDVRSSVAEGLILCAEKLLASKKPTDAARLYDLVRKTQVPRQRLLEATRGAILARGAAGVPLLLEQLRSPDSALFGIGLRTARELPGREATKALIQELDRTPAERQSSLLLAVVDRRDQSVLPKVIDLAQRGTGSVRKTALGLLERFGDPVCVAVLLQVASEGDAELTRIGRSGLARLEGTQVDADLLARIPTSTGRTRQVLLEIAGLRRMNAALPSAFQSAEDADPAVRRAALDTLGILGNEQQAAELVGLMTKVKSAKDRNDIERALTAICARSGKASLRHVLALTKAPDADLRQAGLRALASVGGAEALAAVQAAVGDSDEAVQDEAVGTLAIWPGNWPEDVSVGGTLLELAKSGRKPAHKIQGMRGYLQFVEESPKLSAEEKLSKVREVLPIAQRPEEKRSVIAVISSIPTAPALELLVNLAEDSSVSEEASLAIIKLAAGSSLKDASKETRQKALQTVLEKSKNDATRSKAEQALKKL